MLNLPLRPSARTARTLAVELLTHCSDTAAVPPPLLTMGRYFYYPALARGGGLTHARRAVTGTATLTPYKLVLRFQAPPDAVQFEIDRTQLPAADAWVAPHALRCPSLLAAPATATYHYTRDNTPDNPSSVSILPLSDWAPHLTGNVTIKHYDARRQLLSGHYYVHAPNQPDPTTPTTPQDPTCTILLAGDFENLRLTLE